IRSSGLIIQSALGDVQITNPNATDAPSDIGPVDVVIFATKLGDMEAAAEACRAMIGPETAVIPFLNGVDAPGVIARVLGDEHACGGVAYISAHIERPGCIRHVGEFARLVFGERDGSQSHRLAAFHALCTDSGIDATLSPHIEVALWEKFALIVAMSGTTAATRGPLGPIRDDPISRDVFEAAMRETVTVGNAKGVLLAGDLVEKQMSFLNTLPAEMKASMLVDLEAGKPLEAPWFSGAVARMGRELGVATPVNDTLFAAMQPFLNGQPES
ncbi:MAG: 2-dehydropantoate 2-reductase, partial [Rhodospirillaceae bacterium]|nr:2-dehydropantoate 2-reductase [Rhodospirillaceae bacterium]